MSAHAVAAAPAAKLGTVAVDQAVRDALARGEQPAVLVKFRGKADLSAAFGIADRTGRAAYVHQTLSAFAANAQASALQTLRAQYHLSEEAREYTVLWVDNSIAISKLSAPMLESLRNLADVESIRVQRTISLPIEEEVAAGPELDAVVSSLTRIKVPDVWALGHKGSGVVLANIDAGVRYTHQALVNQYRGNLGGGNFDHKYNWYDPYNHAAVPRYTDPHGSHTMGTMVGDNGTTEQIGVAPAAKWINCIGFGQAGAGATDAGLIECGQWMIAPTDIAGNAATADPSKHPDVVNNSWGDCDRSYDTWYEGVIDGWIAAGIAPVFSNGNNSNCGYSSNPPLNTVGNPARSGKVLGVGSTGTSNGAYATHSNKGPTDNPNPGVAPYPDHFGFPNVKPNIVAPGVSIRSAMSSSDSAYGGMSGTSMSAPATTGVIGLMWSAAPCLKGNYARTGTILMNTAVRIPVATGSPADGPGNIPNQATGWGEVDALAAVNAALAFCAGGAPPSVAVSFAPANVQVDANSTATITLNNPNAGVATLTADLVDTLPAGLVASSATTTCGGTASFTAGTIKLASGATIPASGSCKIDATVKSATAGSYVNTIAAGALKTDKGDNAAAASATLTVSSGGTDPNLVCATPNKVLVETFDGSSINWITGVIDDVGNQIHWNPYNAASSGPSMLAFFWPSAGGGGGASAGGKYSVLQAGDTVGSSSTFITDTGAQSTALSNWRAGADGYLGFKLSCTGGTCYGYAHLKTTAANGFPATLVDYCYNKQAGSPITIAGGGGGDVAPTVSKSFAPASVAVNANSTATITLNNANATVATLTADLVDTLPNGLVASSATTTCGGTASFTAGTIKLASGATIPANGSCKIDATVKSATAGSYVNTIAAGGLKTDKGNNAAAASATLTVTGGGSDPDVVCSADINANIPETIDGLYINFATGQTSPTEFPGYNFDPYKGGGKLLFYWAGDVAPGANGGVAETANGPYKVLAVGDQIGPSSTFSAAANGTNNETANFTAGVDGYLGVKFLNSVTSQTNYGYVRLKTTASSGFPAQIVSYCYNKAGNAITIAGGGGGGDPVANVTPSSISLSAAQNASANAPLTIANTGGGSLTFTITEAAAARTSPSSFQSSLNARAKGVSQSGALARNPQAGSAAMGRPFVLDATQISQMADNTPGDEGVSCGTQGVSTADNSWWRRFYFNEHPQVGASANITSVTVSSGSIAIPSGLPVTINLYTIPHSVTVNTIPTGQLTLIGTKSGVISGSLASVTIPVTGTVSDTVGKDLVVEVHTDGNASGGQFFPGANATAETHPTFLSSATCGVSTPTTAAGLGFPDFHLTMVVSVEDGGGTPGGCQNPSDIPWLSASPASGSVAGGANTNVTVAANTAGLAIGTYSANLCVATNDPAHAMVTVPVSLNVTSTGGGNGVIRSAPLNHTIAATTAGTSLNIVSSAMDDSGPISGNWDFNFWASSNKLTLWKIDSSNGGQYAVDGSGNAKLFQVGEQVGPGTTFTSGSGSVSLASAWLTGTQSGYLGVKFNCNGRLANPVAAPGVCYGYVRLKTTGPNGFPATILDTAFDGDGNAITITGDVPPSPPVAVVTPNPLTFTVQEGASGTNPLTIGNTGGTDLTYAIAEAAAARLNPPSYKTAAGRVSKNPDLAPKGSLVSRRALGGELGFGRPVILDDTMISQMADNTPGDEGVSCGTQGVSTADNSWWRRFYFNEHPQVGASANISSVTVSSGSIAIPGGLPVTINLYTIPHSVTVNTIPTGQLTLIGTKSGVMSGSLTSVTIPVTGTVTDTVGKDLVVEVHTDGNDSGGQFFPGANATAETHPTFLSSATCGVSTPTTAAGLGFPDFHLTMVVNLGDGGTPSGCQNPSDIPWLSETPASGTVAPGAQANVAVTANASTLAAGSYSANLCVTTNDPQRTLITVPVSLTVTSAPVSDGIFCSGFEMGEDGSCGSGGGDPFTQPLKDPSFEATIDDGDTNPFWASTDTNAPGGSVFYSSAFGIDVHTGDWEAWFGGWRATQETQTFSQTVEIKSGGPRFINYWRNVVAEPIGTATLKVYVDSTVVATTDVVANGVDPDWTNVSVDISSFADGQQHTIKFEYKTAGADDGNMFVDDVTIDDHAGSARRRR